MWPIFDKTVPTSASTASSLASIMLTVAFCLSSASSSGAFEGQLAESHFLVLSQPKGSRLVMEFSGIFATNFCFPLEIELRQGLRVEVWAIQLRSKVTLVIQNAQQQQAGPHLQHQALVKVVGAGPSLQGGEGHVGSGEGRYITELVRAQGGPLVISWPDEGLRILPIGLPTRGAVVLICQPRPPLLGALVDGEALRPTGVEF